MTLLAIVLALLPPLQDTLPYRFTLENRQSIQSTVAGQGVQNNLLRMNGSFIVIIDDTVGGSSVAVRFDSVQLHSSNPVMAGMLPSVLTGTQYHFVISDGKPTSVPMPDSLTIGAIQVMPVVNSLFPTIRLDATLGDRWSDTTTIDSLIVGQRMTGVTTTNWRVIDRQTDTLKLDADIAGSARADLGDRRKIKMSTSGTNLVAISPGQPAYSTTITAYSTIDFSIGTMTVNMVQELKLSLTRRDLRSPRPRKTVPL